MLLEVQALLESSCCGLCRAMPITCPKASLKLSPGLANCAYLEVVEVVSCHALHTIIDETTQRALASACESTLQCTSACVLPA